MFDSVGWGEILVLVIAGLFILGPERLPGAAAWLGRAIRQVREYAGGARDQLRNELGPEFDELRKPLEELRGLRTFNPRSAGLSAARSFFDDEEPKPNGHAPGPDPTARATPPPSLAKDERPPIDEDAT